MRSAARNGPRPSAKVRWRVLLGALLASGLLTVAGLALRRELSHGRAARAARRAVASGQFTEAAAPLARWLRADPDSAEAHFLAARVAFATDRPSEAERELSRARALGYSERPIARLEAFLLVLRGRGAEALPVLARLYREARQPDPEVDEALARVLLQNYRLREAAAVLERWARDAPRDPRPYLWMTEIDRRDRMGTNAAIEHYRTALALAPDDDRARLGLAEMLRSAHRLDESAPEFERYLARHPDDPAARTGAGLVALDRGDLATAADHLDRALALDPDRAAALSARAQVDLRQGAPARALERLDRAVRLDPFDVEIHHRRGLALDRLGRSADARAEHDQARRLKTDQDHLIALRDRLETEPGNDQIRLEIARWMFAHGQDDQGIRWAQTIPAGRPARRAASRLLAEHYRRRGQSGLANYYQAQAADGP